jgi:hypothetical protein
MSVSNLFQPGGLRWHPDADEVNAPAGSLLRADNMVPDEDEGLIVRRGTAETHTFPDGTEDVHSLHTVELADSYTYRMMGVDSTLYVDPHPGNHTAHWERIFMDAASFETLMQFNYTGGDWEKDYASSGDVGPIPYTEPWEYTNGHLDTIITTREPVNFNVTFAGSGDYAFGNDHQQIFIARSTSKYKFDGGSLMNWGIAKPATAASLSAIAPQSKTVATFASGEANIVWQPSTHPDTTITGAVEYVDDEDAAANQATKCTPGRIYGINYFEIAKSFASDTDFSSINGKTESGQDIIDIAVWFADPKHVRKFELLFYVGNPAAGGAYNTRYVYDFNV